VGKNQKRKFISQPIDMSLIVPIARASDVAKLSQAALDVRYA
jgi:hypothetical protein